jgi:type I restriction enzyme S subunit
MELMKGYKQIELGLFPEDWEIIELSDIFSDFRGGAPLKPSDFTESGIKVIPKGGIGRTGWLEVYKNEYQFCSKEFSDRHLNNQVNENYTLVVLRDLVPSGPSIGLIVKIRDPETFILAQGVYGFKLNEHVDNSFLVQLSNTSWYRKLMKATLVGSTQVHITNTAFKKLKIPLPPLPEQTAIATALSDMDALIAQTEKLIEKKKAIKQGAMQELLKPKEGWVTKKLGELAVIHTGKKNNQDKIVDGEYPFFVRSQTIERINSYSFDGEAILIPGEGNIGKIFHYINGKFDFHQRVYKISDFKDGITGIYIYRYMTEYFGRHALENSVKATVDSLRLPTIQSFNIPFPLEIMEQKRITNILNDIDKNITIIQNKLNKLKQQKQGMMQALLTGKIRLV